MSKEPKMTIKCIGKQQPSQQAIDRFIKVYKKMVKYVESQSKIS